MAISLNKVLLVGRVGGDPDARGRDGNIVRFSLATSESWKDRDTGERQERTQWHNVVVMAPQTAKFVKDYVRKGDLVMVEGSVEYRKWEKDGGETVNITEIIVRPFGGSVQSQSQSRDGGDRGGSRSRSDDSGKSSDRRGDSGRGRTYADELDDEIPF